MNTTESALTAGLIQAAAYIDSGRVQKAADVIQQTLVDYRANIVNLNDRIVFDMRANALSSVVNGTVFLENNGNPSPSPTSAA